MSTVTKVEIVEVQDVENPMKYYKVRVYGVGGLLFSDVFDTEAGARRFIANGFSKTFEKVIDTIRFPSEVTI